MVVRKGYKQTEIGIVPNDWDIRNILENSTLKGRIGWQGLTTVEYRESGKFYLVTGKDFENGKINWNTCVYVDKKRFDQDKNIQLNIGDVLVTKDGTIGKIAYVHSLPLPATLNTGVFVIRSKNNQYLSLFLYYLLTSNYFKNFLAKLTAGSTITHLYQKDFANFSFVIPDIDEQEKIIRSLSDIDELIEKLDYLIKKKKNIKQGTMQELLTGKRRLEGFGGDWKTVEIGNRIDLLTGFPFPSNQYSINGIRLLRGSNIKRGYTDWSEDITEYWEAITPNLRKYLLNEGDIVVAMDGSLVGKSFARISQNDLPALLLQRVARIRSTSINMDYLKEWICSEFFTKYCDSIKTASAIPHISPDDIKKFSISIPDSKEEQFRIAKILSDMDCEIEALEKQRDKYINLKQGMMQKLLTGEIRLV